MSTSDSVSTKPGLGLARKLTFIGTVKSESATDLHLFVNGAEIGLDQDGDTFSGKKAIDAGANVSIDFKIKGFNGTEWSMEVDIDCPENPAKVIAKSGKIGSPGGNGFETSVQIPDDPCAGGK